jgi:hypothetical protein
MDVGIDLGVTETGLVNFLRMQLINYDGSGIGASIQNNPPTSILTEIGNGMYLWHYEEFPDNFRGGIKVYNINDPLETLGFSAVNPEDIENIESSKDFNITIGRSDANFTVTGSDDYQNLEDPKFKVKSGVAISGTSDNVDINIVNNTSVLSPKFNVKTGVK